MKFSLKMIAVSIALAAAPLAAQAAPIGPASGLVANSQTGTADVTQVGFKKRSFHRHRRFKRSHAHRNRIRRHRHFRGDVRGFDRARVFTDGPAFGPNGERRVRSGFRNRRGFFRH
ncbi:MAG: hypothetical protein OXR62_00905 [Ahrensia sp.]|nr:hypothetical protein [Ahrensia sp.]